MNAARIALSHSRSPLPHSCCLPPARLHIRSTAANLSSGSSSPFKPYDGGNISSEEDVGASPTELSREPSRTTHLPVSFGDIAKANFRVKNAVFSSECRWSEKLSKMYGLDLYFKMEHEQRTVSDTSFSASLPFCD